MKTLYIEEIPIEGDGDDCETFSPGANFTDEVNAKPEARKQRSQCNLEIVHLKSCPHPIGGGSSITVVGGVAYVFGGCNHIGVPSNSLHCYDIAKNEWTCNAECNGKSPSARFGHSAVAFQSRIYVYGGQGFAEETNHHENNRKDIVPESMSLESLASLYYLDTVTMRWEVVDACNGVWPKCRNSQSAIVVGEHREKFVIFGGANEEDGPNNDLWSFDFKLNTWSKIEFDSTFEGGVPCKREMHSASMARDGLGGMYVCGGRNQDGTVCQDLWVFHFDENKWKQLATPPSPRCAHIADFSHTKKLDILGGWDGESTMFSDCVTYDPAKDQWEATHELEGHNFTPKFAHCACRLSEEKMLVVGGVNPYKNVSDFTVVWRKDP